MEIHVTKDNIKILDSYKVHKASDMKHEFMIIKNNFTNEECSVIHVRSINSLVYEWQAHNLLYDLHYKRKQTKDVDLNNESTIRKVAFFLLSRIYLIANIIRVN